MAAIETNEGAVDTWSGILTDAVARCGRDSERKLYLYGISSNRCAKCHGRLEPSNDTCASCNYTHKTPRKCTRCSQKNNPVMWCEACDAYFCELCHAKPHVLMLGSTKPHRCFPIDDASGKYFVEAAWSKDFMAMLEANYRLRLDEKAQADKGADKEPTQATGQLEAPAVDKVVESTATTTTLLKQPLHSAEGSSSPAAVNAAAEASSASAPVEPPLSSSRPNTEELSRKRQLLDADDTCDRLQKSNRVDKFSHSGGQATASPTATETPAIIDGMTLYDRVKEMHDNRVRAAQSNAPQARSPKTGFNRRLSQTENANESKMSKKNEDPIMCCSSGKREQDEQEKRGPDHVLQQREQHRLPDQEQAEQSRMEQKRLDHLERLRAQKQQEEERLKKEQEKKRLQAERSQQAEQQRQASQRWQEKRNQDMLRQQEKLQERKQQLMKERMRQEQVMRQQDEARSLMPEGNQFVSHAQYVLHAQPVYASMASSSISAPMAVVSMASPNISTLMSTHNCFTQVPSPVSVSPHAPRFEPAVLSSQNYSVLSNPGVSAAFSPMRNDHVYQEHTAVPVSRFETVSQDHDGKRHLVIRAPNVQQGQQQTHFPDVMVPQRIAAGTEGGFNPSKSGEDDELRAIWVSDYDNVNALVMQLNMEITKRTEEGHSFVHMSNNITIPEQLQLQLTNLRAQRDAATKKRFKSLARVLIFSNAVRLFAQQNEHSNIWSDVPEVLKVSHKNCAALAIEIRESDRQAQKLREGIDKAVSSGDPVQMQNVARLGAHIADLEGKIRTLSGERDKQFTFMFQFSSALRNMVRAEWAATGRDYQTQLN
ncbi:unnamed protein product [Peronospora farinosa]|uniref:B box-type domain-containing protein n=1 Tax=Peronospora farinosa TaxID=134698 RepID=A0AAV0SZF3_9STRA|nr:unnamed protein product [Peronospora farinosa]CAI5710892.1 unnamed protein product [Peronospora farinosa]